MSIPNPIVVDMGADSNIPVIPMQIENNIPTIGLGLSEQINIHMSRVLSVNGEVGDVVLDAEDVGALPDTTVIPTKTSELVNDSGFITNANIPTKTSDLVNDSGFVSDSAYVHTDNNFTDADLDHLNNLYNLHISVDGDSYRVINLAQKTVSGIEGVSIFYDDGSLEGHEIFIPDGVGFTTYDNYIQLTYATKAEVPSATSDLTNDSGFITSASVPTKTSDLTNDSGFITGSDVPSNEQDPTVPSWAKASTKPSYTASEVHALPDTTVIPTATSDLTNDSGFITSSDIPTAVSSFTNDVPYAVANAQGAALNTTAIPFATVDATSTSTVFTATVPGITEYKDGVIMMLRNSVVTSAAGFTINVNNLGAKHCFNNMALATADTTLFNINYTMIFVYNSGLDVVDGVAQGGWYQYRGYNSDNNTIGYQIRTNSMSLPINDKMYRYRICFTSMAGDELIPSNSSTSTNATATRAVTQTPIDPFGRIVYYSGTAAVNANTRPSATTLWAQYALTLGYSFNRIGAALNLTLWKPVWIKAAPQTDGSAIIDATEPYVQDLPTTEDGKIYIFLGVAYSATQVEMTLQHPVKYYHDGAIRNWWG